MDLFRNIRRHEYEGLDGGLDTGLFERQAMLRSELRMLYPDLERYIQASLCRFADEMTPSLKSASRSMALVETVRLTAMIAIFSVRKAAWRELLPEQGRSGTWRTNRVHATLSGSTDLPESCEILAEFESAFPAMRALVPQTLDFKGELPVFIDYARNEALSKEQTFGPEDVLHALHLVISPECLAPFPRLTCYIDERAMRAYQSFRRAGAGGAAAECAYQFAQLLPSIAAAAMVRQASLARVVPEAVDS